MKTQKEDKENHDNHVHSDQESEEGHNHEGGIFGVNTELYFAILSGVCLAIGYGFTYINGLPSWSSLVLYIAAYFF
ncbi:hypothetical protein [Pedobacter punctiformis]|uniref:Uncharacterized protein n=1 Tax=Pedobacter punctiformis TaxID=3004097 RepID=A0ABT4L865_9SPHI|nr:hypothetical protein [Pedobacter sp. HCMS5-2]MCZ4244090.1 hypothetical protein [Pedobacter sp. HCMS5-2]